MEGVTRAFYESPGVFHSDSICYVLKDLNPIEGDKYPFKDVICPPMDENDIS